MRMAGRHTLESRIFIQLKALTWWYNTNTEYVLGAHQYTHTDVCEWHYIIHINILKGYICIVIINQIGIYRYHHIAHTNTDSHKVTHISALGIVSRLSDDNIL